MRTRIVLHRNFKTSQLDSAQQTLQFLRLLFIECHKNEQLKKALIQDPIKTLEKLTGKSNKLPDGYTIKVEDQSDSNTIYLNIPPKPKA